MALQNLLALGPFVSTWKNGQFGGATPTGDYIEYLTANRDPSVPTRLLRLEQKSKDADDFGSALRSIQSWFRTGWVTDGTPFQFKRWAHLEVIYQAGTAQSFSAQVFSDWDSDNIKTEVKFNRPDQNDNFLKVGQGAIAPSRQEIVRPLGTPRPGAALVVTPGAFVDAIWDDPVVTWDSLTTLWDGGTSLPPGFAHRADGTAYPIPVPIPGGEIYAPVTVTTEPCQESNPLYPVLAPSTTATAYGIARVSIPIARATQIRFTGALPSKEWAVRAFMGEYREVYG